MRSGGVWGCRKLDTNPRRCHPHPSLSYLLIHAHFLCSESLPSPLFPNRTTLFTSWDPAVSSTILNKPYDPFADEGEAEVTDSTTTVSEAKKTSSSQSPSSLSFRKVAFQWWWRRATSVTLDSLLSARLQPASFTSESNRGTDERPSPPYKVRELFRHTIVASFNFLDVGLPNEYDPKKLLKAFKSMSSPSPQDDISLSPQIGHNRGLCLQRLLGRRRRDGTGHSAPGRPEIKDQR